MTSRPPALRPPSGRPPVVVCLRASTADLLRDADLGCIVVDGTTGEEPPPDHQADVCFGGSACDDAALPWARGVRWVHLTGAGVDNVPASLLHDRVVTNSPGINAGPVSEFALAAMLAFAKDLPAVWSSDTDHTWRTHRLDVLRGRTLGLLGWGHIGSEVGRLARSFGMRVIVTVRRDRSIPDMEVVDLDRLAAESDQIVLTASADASTRHIVGARFLALAKHGAHLVNVSRGSLIDDDALREALDSGVIARASLDVTEPEPLPPGHWLRTHPSVRLSPHIAGQSVDAAQQAVDRFAANYRRYAAGEPLADVVSLSTYTSK